MDIQQYVAIARRRWVLIVGLSLIGALLGFALSMFSPRVYTATAQNFVAIGGTGEEAVYGGSNFALQRVKSYVNVVDSPSVLVPAASRLGLDYSTPELAAMVSASNPPQTVLLNVSATGSSPQEVADIANAVAARYAEVIELLETPQGAAKPVKVSVLQEAFAPTAPVSPRTTVNVALGLLLGLGAGVGIALLLARLDTSVRTLDGLVEAAAGPALGLVPVAEDPLPALSAKSEAFRTIRTNLSYIDVDQPPRVVAVVSAQPGEGKTTLALNLGIALAQAGRRVCVVEADMRRPALCDRLGIASSVGLTSVITGAVPIEHALVPWRRGMLTVLPSGDIPPNPSELLGSASFGAVLASLRERYDVVIVDAAPLLPVADGSLVALAADGALLVARYGRTSVDAVARARESLDRVGARLLGVVLNAVPAQAVAAYGYGYGYGGVTEPGASHGAHANPWVSPRPAEGDEEVALKELFH